MYASWYTRVQKKNLKLLDESCKPWTQLIKDQFSRLQLKGVPFRVPEEASGRDIDELFKSLNLDKSVTPYDCVDDLHKRPKLTQHLAHCCFQRAYFFSVKNVEVKIVKSVYHLDQVPKILKD